MSKISWNSRYQVEGISVNEAVAESFEYDALGRRVKIISGVETNYLIYDGMHVAAEVNASGSLVRSYTHGPGVDNILSMTDHTGASPVTYYYITDHLGTVHAVVDSVGSVVESYRFDAWGRVLEVRDGSGTPITESAIGNRYLWQGREYSWSTGLYNFRARWYDPITGRWLSNDPIGIAGGLNQYVFCDNNPVMFRDPWGLCKDAKDKWAKAASIGGLAGPLTGLAAAYPVALIGGLVGDVALAPFRPFIKDMPSPTIEMHKAYREAIGQLLDNMKEH